MAIESVDRAAMPDVTAPAAVTFEDTELVALASIPPPRMHIPWWYSWVKSWRVRMWLETGIWGRR